MSAPFDLLLRGATVVNHDGIGLRDIAIAHGRIAAIGALGAAKAIETVDAKGLHILPGVIDTQVHFREPGLEQKEDLETGSRAAVMGGVTSRVRDAEHQAADHDRRHLGRQGRPRPPPHVL